jgi:hypothetical protein
MVPIICSERPMDKGMLHFFSVQWLKPFLEFHEQKTLKFEKYSTAKHQSNIIDWPP